jgi:hypothetical protein
MDLETKVAIARALAARVISGPGLPWFANEKRGSAAQPAGLASAIEAIYLVCEFVPAEVSLTPDPRVRRVSEAEADAIFAIVRYRLGRADSQPDCPNRVGSVARFDLELTLGEPDGVTVYEFKGFDLVHAQSFNVASEHHDGQLLELPTLPRGGIILGGRRRASSSARSKRKRGRSKNK